MTFAWTKRTATGALVALVLIAGGCGDDDDAATPAGSETTAPAGGAAAPSPVPIGDGQGELSFCEAATGLERLESDIGDDRSPEMLERFVAEFPGLFRSYASNPPEELIPQVQTVVGATLRALLGAEDTTQSPEYIQASAEVDAYVAANCEAPPS